MAQWLYGSRTDTRTRTMLAEAERLAGKSAIVVQGSYSHGSASAGTHSGGGALDLRTRDLTTLQRGKLLHALRTVGFAAWYRKPPAFDVHIHAIAIGCPDLSSSARNQVADYYDRKNGLANNGPDDGPWMRPIQTWEQYQGDQGLPDTGAPEDDDMTPAQMTAWAKSPEGKQALADAHAYSLKHGSTTREELPKLAGTSAPIGSQLIETGKPLTLGIATQRMYNWMLAEAKAGNRSAIAALATPVEEDV